MEARPTEVQDWKLCPQYWKFKHVERWKPKTVHKWEVQAWIGTGIHAGIAAWVTHHEDPSGCAQAAFAVCQAEALAQGREGTTPTQIEDALTSVRVNTKKYVAQAPAWLQTDCWGTEVKFEGSSGRLDWLGQMEDGTWRIVDFKTKRTKPRNLEAYQWGLRRSWQFSEYVAYVKEYLGGVIEERELAIEVEVHTIILDKFEVMVDTFTPPKIPESERLKVAMEMDPKGGVWRNEQHCRNWFGGDCPYLRACWEYERDEQRMRLDYLKTEEHTPHEMVVSSSLA